MSARSTIVGLALLFLSTLLHAQGDEKDAKPPVKTGPAIGAERVIFHPLVVNGEHKGKKYSVVQTWRAWPAVLIFARSESDALADLVRRLDQEAKKVRAEAGEQKKVGHFGVAAVYISTDEAYPDKLGKWAEKQGFESAFIGVEYSENGPPKGWQIAADADITIIFLERATVRAVHGFRRGEFTPKEVERIMKEAGPFARRKLNP